MSATPKPPEDPEPKPCQCQCSPELAALAAAADDVLLAGEEHRTKSGKILIKKAQRPTPKERRP